MRTLMPLALLAFGCGGGPFQAPFSARLDMPEDIQVGWSEEVNDLNDGYGSVFIVDVLVYDTDTETGEIHPVENVEVEVTSGWGGLYLLPAEAVNVVDPPELPEDVTSPSDVKEYCEDEDGNFDNTEEWCSWYYDTITGQYYEFGTGYADAGGYSPNYAQLATDGRGLARVFLYLDSLPSESGGESGDVAFQAVQFTGSIGHHSEATTIEPAQ